ncbi:MAG: ABC transporter permease [Longimicrobiaceae bacterium]
MGTLLQDLRYSARGLSKAPGFTALVVLTLALGIGANTAIFSVVNALLLRPLPYAEADRLVRLFQTFPTPDGRGTGSVSPPNFRDWREQNRSFEELTAYTGGNVNLQGVDTPERLSSVAATANLFSVLGVQPQLGRGFAAGEDELGVAPVVVLSDGLWRRRFGADPALIGQTILLDGQQHTVIGVMPPDFRFPAGSGRTEVWVPLQLPPQALESRGSNWMTVMGRLRPGVSLEAAQAEMSGIARRLEEQYPEIQEGRGVLLRPVREVVIGDVRPRLLMLLGAAGFVLLIACANAANLLLARSTARRREIAVRTALGATRGRVVQQFLAEALLLALGGAVVGLLLARQTVAAVVALAGQSLPRAGEISFDAGVFAFLLLATLVSAVAFGLVPALRATGARLHEDLKEGGVKASGGRGGVRFRGALVVAQIALSLVLLVGAGLLMRTFGALLGTETGMQTDNVLTMSIAIPPQRYPEGDMVERFHAQVRERVQALPGVRAAGWTSNLPLQSWGMNGWFEIPGRPEPVNSSEQPFAEFRLVSPGYFAALGIPVVRGRDLSPQDGPESPVVLINRTLSDRYFPNEDPVGRRIVLNNVELEIVGVMADVRQAELALAPLGELYLPYDVFAGQFGLPSYTLVVSTQVPPTTLTGAVRGAIRSVDPEQPVYNVQTMQQVVRGSISDRQLYLWLLGTFAGIALLLAAAGIYGVISHSVTQRTREIGIRMALGAGAGTVLGLVVRHGATLALLGLVIGVSAAFALTRLLQGLLYGVSATDPLTFAAVGVLLTSVAMLASYLPARRATRVDPMIALRAE